MKMKKKSSIPNTFDIVDIDNIMLKHRVELLTMKIAKLFMLLKINLFFKYF